METLPAAQAVESLIHEYGKLVFHTIYALTNDWELSQDLTQETFLSALRAIDAARTFTPAHGSCVSRSMWCACNTDGTR